MTDTQHSQQKEALEDAANRLLVYKGQQIATLSYTETTPWVTHDDSSVSGTNFTNAIKWSAWAIAAFEAAIAAGNPPPVSPPPPPQSPPPPPPPPPPSPPPPPTGTGGSPNFKYVTGFGLLPPDYADHPALPAQGAGFDDPGTGAFIERLTDCSSWGTTGASFPSIRNLYSQFAYDSYDGKLAMGVDVNGNAYVCDNTTGELVSALSGVTENRSPRWDYSGEALSTFYYTNMTGGQLRARDVATGADTLVHDFSDLIAKYPSANGIFMDGHADTDNASRLFPIQILCFAKTGSYYALAFALYDRKLDKVVGILDSSNIPADPSDPTHPLGDIHSAPFSVSRDGQYVCVQWQAPPAGSPLVDSIRDGSHAYAITFDAQGNPNGIDAPNGKRINPRGGHMCWAFDTNGKCWAVAQNPVTDWLEAVDPAVGIGPRATDATQTLSMKIVNMDDKAVGGWPSGNIHFSAPYRGALGYVAILFDSKDDSVPCANQTMVFALKPNAVPLRIAPSYHTNPGTGGSGDNYSDQHYAAFSQDGNSIIWASNWRNDSGQRDLMKVTLPAGWQSKIP